MARPAEVPLPSELHAAVSAKPYDACQGADAALTVNVPPREQGENGTERVGSKERGFQGESEIKRDKRLMRNPMGGFLIPW